jgi:hypothetical protein
MAKILIFGTGSGVDLNARRAFAHVMCSISRPAFARVSFMTAEQSPVGR